MSIRPNFEGKRKLLLLQVLFQPAMNAKGTKNVSNATVQPWLMLQHRGMPAGNW
jgi:hypothetical protein